MMDVLVGIDVGTSNMKFIAITPGGKAVRLVVKKTQIDRPREGWSEFNILTLKQNIYRGLRELVEYLPPEAKILSIGIDSIGESIVGINEFDEVITPCPTWYDRRTKHKRKQFGLSEEDWFNITGMVDDDIYTLYRIDWFKERYFEDFNHVKKWMCVSDYVVYLLTGEMVGNPSLSARTGLLDRNTRQWSDEMLKLISLSKDSLPEIRPQCSVAGYTTESILEKTNIPSGTPVINSGHDHPCATFGCSISNIGKIIDSTGTAEAINTLVSKPLPFKKVNNGSYDCYPYVIEDYYNLSGHLPQSGGLFEWMGRLVTGTKHDSYLTIGYMEELFSEALSSDVGARGIRIIPFLEGSGSPWHKRNKSSSILGIKSHHNRGDIIRAVFESTGFWLKSNVNYISKITNHEYSEVISTGGGSKSNIWVQIKSAILEKPFAIPIISEAAALGAALIGGLAIGLYKDPEEATALEDISWKKVFNEVEIEGYRSIFESYKKYFTLALENEESE
jgi:sugar (pentulose or hexulose) kinase